MLLSQMASLAEGEEFLLGAFLGAMTLMALYHLALYVAIRERGFLYYAMYLLAFASSTLVWDGTMMEAVVITTSTWGPASYVIVDVVAAIAAIQFVREFLGTREHFPRCDKTLVGTMAVAVLTIPLAFGITWDIAIEIASVLSIAGPLLLLAVGMIGIRHGSRPARYLLVACSIHLVGIMLDSAIAYAPVTFASALAFTDITFYGGTVLMMVLFALGLADRYNQQQAKRLAAEAENKSLQVFSYKDGLTGIWNRRRLDEVMTQEWQRALRDQKTISMILLDVDHFKKYNDHYGHQAGDDCLYHVAEALDRTATRAADFVARYGGEEFAVLVPDVDADEAQQLAELMRQSVANLGLPHADSTAAPYVTVSVGVATQVPDEQHTAARLVEAADRALYQAKESGRNRVCRDDAALDECQVLTAVNELELEVS